VAIMDALVEYIAVETPRQLTFRALLLALLISMSTATGADILLTTLLPALDPHVRVMWFVYMFIIVVCFAVPLLFGFGRVALDLTVANDKLARLASRDPLTGLLNRRAFADQFELLARKARRHGDLVALLLLDADHFKSINDTFGHDVGDRVLMHIASVVSAMSGEDAVVGRLGGEEFGVAFSGRSDAATQAERVRAAIQASALWQGDQRVSLTVSAGAVDAEASHPLAELMRIADKALYAAKAGGRNRVTSANANTPPSLQAVSDEMVPARHH
jgi:diguanylate cyclase